jgi:hypothetical protein
LRTDHKPLEWLATVSDANGRRGRWIDMLQDFSLKFLHRPGMKHGNADALSRNPVGQATDDDDFSEKVQDVGTMPDDLTEATKSMFSVQYGQDSYWFGFRRHAQQFTEHRWCCFGINHWRCSTDHHLFMFDVVTEVSQDEEDNSPVEDVEEADSEGDQNSRPPDGKRALKERGARYYDRQQQLELVLAAQQLSEFGEHESNFMESNEGEISGVEARHVDIWQDTACLELLKEGQLPDTVDLEESKRARKRASKYCWKEQKLYFKGLYVPEQEERIQLVI